MIELLKFVDSREHGIDGVGSWADNVWASHYEFVAPFGSPQPQRQRSPLTCVCRGRLIEKCPRREKDDCNGYGVADQECCRRLVSIQPALPPGSGFDFARSTPLGYPEGLQCTEVPLTDFEADIFQAAVAQVLQFSTVIMAFPAK
jgi:hypothetical protein